LEDHLAWVQVQTDAGHQRHVRFYRWTERGWVQAPPDLAFWGEPVAWQHEGLLVQATARDRPYAHVLAAHMWDVAQAVCSTLGCSDDLQLRVTFLPDAMGPLPRLSAHGLLLPSPWLTGIPESGKVDPASLDRLTYWTAYYVTAAAVKGPGPARLSQTQRAILAEYARFYTEGDLNSVPILRRIAERHGADVLPHVLRSLPDAPALADWMTQWLALPEENLDMYYLALLDIAQDPATPACKETFVLLLQQEDAGWRAWMQVNHAWVDGT
jgi:hypothetical protein